VDHRRCGRGFLGLRSVGATTSADAPNHEAHDDDRGDHERVSSSRVRSMSDTFLSAKKMQVEPLCNNLLIFADAKMRLYVGRVNTLPALLLAAAGVGFGHAVMPDHWLPLAVLSRTRRYSTGKVVRLSLAAALAHVVVSLVLGGILVLIGLQFRATIAHHTDLIVGGILLATGLVFLVLDLLGKGHGHSHDGDGHHGHGHGHGHGQHRDHDHDGHEHEGHGHGHHRGDHGHDHGPHGDHHHEEHEGLQHAHAATAVLDRPKPSSDKRSARGLADLLIPFGAAASPDLTILPVFLAAGALGATAAVGSLLVFTLITVATIVSLTTATTLGARLLTAPWIDRRANLITAVTLVAIAALIAGGLI
jgi:hypothetical protein